MQSDPGSLLRLAGVEATLHAIEHGRTERMAPADVVQSGGSVPLAEERTPDTLLEGDPAWRTFLFRCYRKAKTAAKGAIWR